MIGETFGWILLSGILMSVIALFGSTLFIFTEKFLSKLLLPLVAFSAGALIGGAFFHLIPASLEKFKSPLTVFIWLLLGFTTFLAIEQFLHWHHCNRASSECKKPLTFLILIGDSLHNFLGGMAIAGTFLIDIRLGITAWLAAASHEIPQELGDMGVLLYGGYTKKKAIILNLLSSLTFLLGGVIVYFFSIKTDLFFLVPFAAGNYLYIGASDLIPEVNKHSKVIPNIIHFLLFLTGLLLLLGVKVFLD